MQQILFSKKILLFLIPLALFLSLVYNLKEINLATIRTVDPEYIHLVSSINLANGQYKLLSIENPATSLYLFNAIVIKLTHFLVANNRSLIDDYLLFPEKYVTSVRASLILITLLSLLGLGLIVYKYTGNLLQALFLQTIPFVSIEILNSCTIICPENFLVIIMIWYISLLVILRKNAFKEIYIVFYFSLLVALGMATKLTFIPLFIPPLFLFSKNKYRFYYLALIGSLALLIAFPVVIQYERFITWVNGLIFHSGLYGTGESKIVDIHLFWENLKKIFNTEILFSLTYIFLFITTVFFSFRKKKSDTAFPFLLSITIVFTIQIALTSKHFAIRYLIPSMMLTTYVIYELGALYLLYYKLLFVKKIKTTFPFLILLIIGLGLFSLIQFNLKYKDHRESRMGAYYFIEKKLAGKPIIIIPNYFGSSSVKYSLYFSAIWTGKYRDQYFGKLNQLFPDTYLYFPWNGKYNKWNSETSLLDILTTYDDMYIYCALDATIATEEDFNQEIKKKFDYYNHFGENITKIKKIYSSKYDAIYKLSIDRNKLINLYHYEEIKCDMENLSLDGKYFETNTNYRFSFNDNRTTATAFSGKYSQFLDKEHPWGCSVKISDVKLGSHYEVTLWKKSTDMNSLIVATTENSTDFYVSSNYVSQVKNGWERLKLTFDVDQKIENKQIQIYIWYNGEGNTFVDDFQIRIGSI